MKRIIVFLLVALLAFSAAAEDFYMTVEQDGLYGLTDAQGNVVVPCEYDLLVWNWENGHYYACKDDQYGVLSPTGETLIPCEWDMLYFTGEKQLHCMVFRGTTKTDWRLGNQVPNEGLWGLYAIDGTELAPCEWSSMTDVGSSLLVVGRDGKKGVIDLTGEMVVPCEWDSLSAAGSAAHGLLVVGRDDKTGLIDLVGKAVVPCEWDGLYVQDDGSCIHVFRRIAVEDGESVYLEGLLALDGSVITPCQWQYVGSLSQGLAAVRLENGFGFINSSGDLVIPCQWDFAWDFADGYAKVEKNGLWGVIDTSGTLVVPCEWETLEALGSGQFKGTKSSIIDLNN